MHGNLQSNRNDTSAGNAVWMDELVEQAWRKLGGTYPRERIREIAADAAARYANATVTAFIPILAERLVRERLRSDHRDPRGGDDATPHSAPAAPSGGKPAAEGLITVPS